jgi:hypothetical protein
MGNKKREIGKQPEESIQADENSALIMQILPQE